MYLGEVDIVHIGPSAKMAGENQKKYLGRTSQGGASGTGAIDHIAFRATGLREMLEHLRAEKVPFTQRRANGQALFQLFFYDPERHQDRAELRRRGGRGHRAGADGVRPHEGGAVSSPEKVAGGVIFCIGLVSFGVLAWASRSGMGLERTLDAGDVVFMSVFAIFGLFCVLMGWRLFRSQPAPPSCAGRAAQVAPALPPRRVTLSTACSTAGVIFLVLAALLPERFYPVVLLFVGIALLAVSHALTPCEERIDKLRKVRDSMRQL